MAKLFDSLLVPEWRKVVAPSGFADGVLRCLRTLCTDIVRIIGLKLGSDTTRPYYRTITAYGDTIQYASDTGLYTMELKDRDIDVFGASLSNACAIVGRDFTRTGNSYQFKKHPSTYGVTTTENGRAVISFICIGGPLEDAFNPLGLPYYGATGENERKAIEKSIHGDAPLGITQDLITATFGCKFSENPLVDTWVEGDMRFGLTDNNELIYAPMALNGVVFSVGKKVDYSALLTPVHYFAAKLINGTFVFSLGLNTLSAIPDLLKNYPELSPLNGTTFIGAELLSILRKKGCVFWEIPYIKQGIDQDALSNYAVNPGKVNINGVVELSGDSTPLRRPVTPTGAYSCETTSMIIYNCM